MEETSSRDIQEELDKLSHEDLCEITQSSLRRLIAADSLLQDLPGDVTAEEVLAQIAVAQGRSITVYVLRHLETPLNVVIPQQGTTVRDLKRAIQRSFTLRQQRLRSKTKISWRYVWRTYDLFHWAKPMTKDDELVNSYGVVNRCRSVMVAVDKVIFGQLLVLVVGGMEGRYPWLEQVTRQEQLVAGCRHVSEATKKIQDTGSLDHVLVDHKHKLLYCYVPKVACTNWKRIFMVLTGTAPNSNLVDIPGSVAHADNSTLRLSQLDHNHVRYCLDHYTAFIVVRHPFERLLSAFRNKFENTYSHYFQLRYGKEIIKRYRPNATDEDLTSGRNVLFREFVWYILGEGATANEHWESIYDLCHPCSVNYTIVGRYETLLEDARTVLDMIDAPSITFPFSRTSNTSSKLKFYFQQLSMTEIQKLYRMYELDFKLFGYTLEDMLGFDLA